METTQDVRLALAKTMESEITDYFTKTVSLSKDNNHSQHQLVRRIALFESRVYPTGKFDKQGNYKTWWDIIAPRIDAEVKNIDFDTKDIEAYSPRKIDDVASLIVNLKLREWLRDNGQAEELNSAIEEGSGWGNVVWKKVNGGYERVDLRNFYVINQTARSLRQSAAIERHQLTQSELREKAQKGVWKNIEKVFADCGQNIYKADVESTQQETTTPIYSIYERNGEVNLKDLKAFTMETVEKGDESKYVFARVIAAGTEGTEGGATMKHILFAEQMPGMDNGDVYKEYHRGRYKGRWWREGLYELLFDLQVRGNEVANQISQGLLYASKTIFTDDDRSSVQNIITDLKNGDFIKSKNLRQVEVRMQGFDQLAAEWNRILEQANEIANSREIIQGGGTPSGMPFKLGQLLDVNANKLYDFIREKISIPFREIFEDWIIPTLVEDLKVEEVLRLTGDSEMLKRLREMVVEDWYIRNLFRFGMHTPEIAATIKAQKMEELAKSPIFLKQFKEAFEDYKARVSVIITGENVNLDAKLQSLATFIQMEADPVRRSYLIEKAMRMKGFDVGEFPRSTPEQLAGVAPGTKALAAPVAEPAMA